MISLPELKALNNRPPVVIRDNFNRDSSFVQSSRGFVIHSGVHRSTAFISKADHQDGYFAFQYWSRQGQVAVNAFVELIIDGADLETCESNAFHKSRPDWQVTRTKGAGKLQGAGELTARRASGLAVESVGATTWRHLHERTN